MKTVTDARLLVTRAAAAGVGLHVDTTAMFSSLGYLYSLDCLAGLTAINMVKEQTQCIKLLTKSRTDLVVCKTVVCFFPFLGLPFNRVDLIKPVSNVRLYARAYIYASVHKQSLGFQ